MRRNIVDLFAIVFFDFPCWQERKSITIIICTFTALVILGLVILLPRMLA